MSRTRKRHDNHLAVMEFVVFAIFQLFWQQLELLPADQHRKLCCDQIIQDNTSCSIRTRAASWKGLRMNLVISGYFRVALAASSL